MYGTSCDPGIRPYPRRVQTSSFPPGATVAVRSAPAELAESGQGRGFGQWGWSSENARLKTKMHIKLYVYFFGHCFDLGNSPKKVIHANTRNRSWLHQGAKNTIESCGNEHQSQQPNNPCCLVVASLPFALMCNLKLKPICRPSSTLHHVHILRRLIAEYKKRTRERYPSIPNLNCNPNSSPKPDL